MRLKTTKRLMNLASLVVLSAAGAVGYWGMMPESSIDFGAPAEAGAAHQDKLTTNEPKAAETKPPAAATGGSSGASLAMDSGRALRRPLFDPPPPAPIVVKAAPQPLRALLLATVIEAENSTAMIKLAKGEVVFRKVGESLGPEEPSAVIAKIETGTISVRRGQEELRLSVEGMNGK
jgi:hypothetical protein